MRFKLHPGPFSLCLRYLSQRSIDFKLRLPRKDSSLVNMLPVFMQKMLFSPIEILKRVIFVITKLPQAQIMVFLTLF